MRVCAMLQRNAIGTGGVDTRGGYGFNVVVVVASSIRRQGSLVKRVPAPVTTTVAAAAAIVISVAVRYGIDLGGAMEPVVLIKRWQPRRLAIVFLVVKVTISVLSAVARI